MKKLYVTMFLVFALVFSFGAAASADGQNRAVAVKTESGVFLSVPKDGSEIYEIARNGEKIGQTSITNYTDKGADGTGQYAVNGQDVPLWENNYLEIPISLPVMDAGEILSKVRFVRVSPASGGEMSIGSSWGIITSDDGVSVFIKDSGEVMDVNAQAVTAGGSVSTYAYNRGDNQMFTLEEADGGYYISGKQSGLYLSVAQDGGVTIEEKSNATLFSVEDEAAEISDAAFETAKAVSGIVTYEANDASVGDLDGDGEWEIVLKWNPSDAKDASQQGTTGKVYIDAYKLDGTMLWRIDMGKNIRAGAHDTQMIVYDLDGDGKAEVALRTSDGTLDGEGNVIGDPDAVWTNNWAGKNLEGPLFITVFDGATGKSLQSVPYDPQNNEPSTVIFGDDYGNRSERYNACVAYLDGEKPYMVFQRGYYGGREGKGPGRTVIAAFSWDGQSIEKYWRFDTMDEGNDKYIGQGNHNISVGDCDSDGKDEIFTGALTLDNDGSVLWCSYMGHGDAMHLGDFDPTRDGLEFFAVHEGATERQKYGFTVFAAESGEILQAREAGKDTGRGLIANIGNFGGSYVAWAGSGAGKINSFGENLDLEFNSMNFRIYWDGDLYDELYDGISVFKVGGDGKQSLIFSADGCAANNGSKSTPCFIGDILGDWREEIIVRTADNTHLRIYTSTIPSEFALPPLPTDHIYRMGMVWQNSSYNQPPHLGYYPAGVAELTIDSASARLNGMNAELDAAPYIENGRTLVPLRFISEALGAKVEYAEGVVTITSGAKKIVMTIGETSYSVNGEAREMECAPEIKSDRTFVPLRAAAEALGASVSWNNETRSAVIKRGGSIAVYERRDDMETYNTAAVQKDVKIFIAGDSTAQSYGEQMAPQAGWGQMLPLFFNDNVTVVNRAMAGRSLKSFFKEGRWQSILDEARAGDYVVIQFGQNESAWQKPERYISHEDFAVMLENEYIVPALSRGLKVIIATQTQSRWFDSSTGKIYPPGDGVSYATLLCDAAEKYSLPLLDIYSLSRELENELGMEESKKLHLYSKPGEYPKYPDGVADDTHFSFRGAFEIASIAAEEMKKQVPDLAARRKSGYSKTAAVEGEASIDVRCYGFADEFAVSVLSEGGEVLINGQLYMSDSTEKSVTARVKPENGFINISAAKAAVEVAPILKLTPEGGIDASGEGYLWDIPDGAYNFTFVKSDTERADISLNSLIVGANVDMYGTVGVPEGTRHTYTDFEIEGGARITLSGRTTRLKSVEAYVTPTVIPRKTKVFVAGDSTLCNYYPVIADKTDDEVLPGTVRTGWGQVLDRCLCEDYEVVNLASSGDWARDWEERIFPTVVNNGKAGDYIIIQFGINDRNRDDKKQETMKDSLKRMIQASAAKGITPILVKPQPSVGYTWGGAGDFEKPSGNNGGFFNAVEETADETGCLFVNLYDLAGEHFAEVGRDYVSRNYQLCNYQNDEMEDKLHISLAGAKKFAALFAENASGQGILESDKYMETVAIDDGLYTLSNGERTKYINTTDSVKTIVLSDGANICVAPYSELDAE